MKHYFPVTLIAMIFSLTSYSQGNFYDLNTIQLIEISFSQSNWDYILDTAYSGTGGYVMASSIKINGVEFDSIGVKYKGNSTYQPNQVKNPFHIELDTYKDQSYEGYTDIKLSNASKDPSFLREVLSYKILRDYMPAPQSNFANVYVNNQLIGLYANTEAVGKKFIKKHFGSGSNTFVKCNPIEGAGPGSTEFPNLVYLGADSLLYYSRYELQSDYGWYDLLNLCDTLANHTSAIENTININQVLWMLAFDNLLVNLDSYIGVFSQNYYLYKDDYSRFQTVIWDLNESFGTFSNTGTINLPNTTAKQQMTHLLHSNDSQWPLVKMLLAVPMYKRMYIAHIRTILTQQIASNTYYNDGLALQNLISASVNADPNKFYSYANFISNLSADVNIGMGSAPGISNLMNGRNTYLNSLSDFTAAQPVISNITVSNSQPFIGSQIFITAGITNATLTGAYLAYRNSEMGPFQRIPMLDDGLHGDGSANDGVFGSELYINSPQTDYYLYAENSQAGIFSPQRAELEFYSVNAISQGAGSLVINEFLASNSTIIADQDNEYDDWIEIYNPGTETVSLDSIFLSDTYNNPDKWAFPADTSILPQSYLIVWADEDTEQNGLHTNFKLSGSGEMIILTDFAGGIIDSITFGIQSTDTSMQRCPDGSGDFTFDTPSFAYSNNCPPLNDPEISSSKLSIYPNPCIDRLYIIPGDEMITSIRIVNITGQNVLHQNTHYSDPFELNLEDLPKGLYMILINDTIFRKIVKE